MAQQDKRDSIKNNLTTAWRYYDIGRQYNNSLNPNYYRVVNTNLEFFAGNQWVNLPQTKAMAKLSKPVFNIIKRITELFVSSMTANATTVNFDTLSYYDGSNMDDPETNAAAIATAEVQNLFDKFKMDYRIREALFDGAVTGDYCAHFYFDPDAEPYGGAFTPVKGEIQMEMVDGMNVMFGNPNCHEVEKQPYILIIGRDTVANLRAEKKQYERLKQSGKTAENKHSFEEDRIKGDMEYIWQAGQGGKKELIHSEDGTDKCLYIYMYTKVAKEEDVIDPKTGEPMMELVRDKDGNPVLDEEYMNGIDYSSPELSPADLEPHYKQKPMKRIVKTVHVTKATKACNIFEDIDTGLSRYPIAWANWSRQKNQYHGRALVTEIIPNQIFINTMFAMVMRHLQLMGFPKTVYNADLIGQWNNEIGQAIAVRNLVPGQRIGDVAANLQPADMSYQIIATIDKVMQYTREMLGASDVQMGNVKPDNTSAMMVLQANAEVPLENPRANMLEWVEDIGAILLDMMGTYYGERPVVMDKTFKEVMTGASGQPVLDPNTGMMMEHTVARRVQVPFDFKQLKRLWLNLRTDAGATSTYSEIAINQTLDNLRREGVLTLVEYLERIPDKLIPRKAELIEAVRAREGTPASGSAQPDPMMGGMPGMEGGGEMGLPPGLDGGPVPPGSGVPDMGGMGVASNGMPSIDMGGVAETQEDIDQQEVINSLPTAVQSRFANMPKFAQDALLLAQSR